MKLNQEGVKKAAEVIEDNCGNGTPFSELVAAALTAYFDHLKEAGLMQEGRGWDHAASGYWGANSSDSKMLPHDFLCVILRTDKE